MRKARIHIYFTTIELPNRNLEDIEFAHDVIDIDIGENERVVQVDIVDRPVYRRVKAAPQPDSNIADLAPIVLKERTVNVRDKTVSSFRARIATIEEIDAVDDETTVTHYIESDTDLIELDEGK